MVMEFGVSGEEVTSEGKSSPKNSLMLYYNRDHFLEMCSDGPYGNAIIWHRDNLLIIVIFLGLAVYFSVDPLPNQTLGTEEDKESNSSQKVCSVSPPDPLVPVPPAYERPPERHWILLKAFSIVKYLLFGAFVLACNKLRRYLKVHRVRTNSSSSSDVIDVSYEGMEEEGLSLINTLQDEFPLLDQLVNTIRRHSSLTDSPSTPLARTPSLQSSSTDTLVSLNRSDSIPESRSV